MYRFTAARAAHLAVRVGGRCDAGATVQPAAARGVVRTVQRAEDVEYRLKAIQLVVTRHKELFPDDNAVYTRVCSELLQTLPLLLEGGAVSEVADASFHSNTSLNGASLNTTSLNNASFNTTTSLNTTTTTLTE